MSNKNEVSWEGALRAAVEETDPSKAAIKVRAAEDAIVRRFLAIAPGLGSAEEHALFEALHTVRLLKSVPRARLGAVQ